MAQRRCTAAWRLRRPWCSGPGTPFVAEAYIAAVLEFVLDYIFKRRSSLEELGVCRWRSSAYVAEEENGGRSSGHGDDNDGSCNHSGDASQD
jgi:hypothetical protein